MKNHLHTETSFIDYVYVITKLLVSNDTNISNIRINQGRRLHKLFLHNSYHISVTFHDPDKVIFNFRVMSSKLLKMTSDMMPASRKEFLDIHAKYRV